MLPFANIELDVAVREHWLWGGVLPADSLAGNYAAP
jgi:hypothetical protein